MTGKNRNTMYPGEKKNRTSKTALLNLSFNRAVRLPFAIILLCDRVETNSIKPVSQGKVTGQKACIHAGLRRFDGHSHSVEQGFLDLAYGVTQEQMTMEQYMGKYYVPFVIWANYPLPGTGPETTSLNFLGQYLLRYAGIAGTPYRDFLWQLQEELPALTFVGYVDQTGHAYSHLETNDFTTLIEDYQRLQYNNLFGGKDRLAAFFDPESGGATGG